MSITAVASRPSDYTALPSPTATEVVTLQDISEYPAVSVLCSTDPAPRLVSRDITRLTTLVTDAVSRLESEFGQPAARPLAERLRDLAIDAVERPSRAGLALYVSSSHASSWALPIPVQDRAVVDPTFATRDLVRSLHRTPRHVVLVLTDREARLFDGIDEHLLPTVGGAFPLTAGAHGGRDAGRRSQRTRDNSSEFKDAFLRTVDRALGTYLRLHPAPLVLVGAQRTLARFLRLSRNTGRLAGTIYGSHARTPLPVLVGLVRPVLERYLRSRQDEALALLDARTDAGRVVSGVPAAWLAARAERPEMLAVEQSLFYPARLSSDGDLLTPADDVDHPEVIDDAVDELIETVLRRGGWIAIIEDGLLAAHNRIALAVRS